jgi:tetratricopeptide (TPR) repeat protein
VRSQPAEGGPALSDVSDEQLWAELSDTSGARRAEVLLELADRCYQRNDLQQFQTLVDAATVAAEESGDDRLSAFARFNQAQGQFESGAYTEAAESFLAAASYFHVIGEHGDVAQSHMRAAESYSNLGEPDRALQHWRTALALYTSDGDQLNAGKAWMLIGGEQMVVQQIADAEESFLAARSAFRTAKSAVHVAWADDAAAEALIHQGRPQEAAPLLRSCLDVVQVGGDDSGLAYAQLRMGAVLRMIGEPEQSLTHLEQARECYQHCEDLLGIARSDLERGHTLKDLQRGDDAVAAYQRARSVFDAIGADTYLSYVDRCRAELLLDSGQFAEAESAARDVLRAAIDSQQRSAIEEAAMLVATSLLELDQPAAALAVVTSHFGSGAKPPQELVVTHLVAWARILAANGQVDEAGTLAEALLTNPEIQGDFLASARLHELCWQVGRADNPIDHLTRAIALYVASGQPERAHVLGLKLVDKRVGAPAEIDLRSSAKVTTVAGTAAGSPTQS